MLGALGPVTFMFSASNPNLKEKALHILVIHGTLGATLFLAMNVLYYTWRLKNSPKF